MKPAISAIIGAGLSGLIAGYAFPNTPIFESSPRGTPGHRALLRFRSDAVSRLTGIPFRRVRVHKGIWSQGAFRAPNVQLANRYAIKCLGSPVGDRSIWNVEPVDRWVAPESLAEQMADALSARIEWDIDVHLPDIGDAFRRAEGNCSRVISTAPLSAALPALPWEAEGLELKRAAIWVRRFRVHGADLHQTVYFPDDTLATYRASVTGDLLIVELRADPGSPLAGVCLDDELGEVCRALGLPCGGIEPLGGVEQRYGKIIPLPPEQRREILYQLTSRAGIYSLGRFATWRNILLDDVVADAEVIRKMAIAGASTNFLAARAAAGR